MLPDEDLDLQQEVDENTMDDAERDALAAAGQLPEASAADPNDPAAPAPIEIDPEEADPFSAGVAKAKEVDTLDPDLKPAKPKEEAKPADPKPAEDKKPADKKDEAKPDDVEEEIRRLGMKEETAKSFRRVTGQNAEYREKLAQAETERDAVLTQAKMALEFQDMVIDTGAQPQQVGAVLGYLKAVNSGDPATIRLGFEALKAELVNVAKMIGEPLELGDIKVDPLDAHPDLKEEVQDGAIDRKRALEIAQYRDSQARLQARAAETTASTRAEEERAQVLADVKDWATKARGKDTQFDAKMALLKPAIAMVQNKLKPSEWMGAIEDLYRNLPAAAAPAAPKPQAPMRAGGRTAPTMDRKPKDDLDAFDMGYQAAKQRGV